MRNIANFEVISLPGGPGKDYLIVIDSLMCLLRTHCFFLYVAGCLVLSKDDSERESIRNILNIFIKNLSKVYQI